MALLTPSSTFRIRFDWSAASSGRAADRTRGRAVVEVGGREVWGGDGGLEWTWVELLEFLTNAWPYLVVEQGYPRPLNPATACALESDLDRLVGEDQTIDEDALRGQVLEFLETHDLAHALQGIVVAPVRLLRRGALMEVSTPLRTVVAPLDDVLATLVEAADAIVDRLHDSNDPRAELAVAGWRARNELLTPELVVAVATGLNPEATSIVRSALDAEPELASTHDNEVLAAARMSGRFVPPTVLRALLDHVRALDLRVCPKLDDLARSASIAVPEQGPDFVQGYELARWARANLGDDDPFAAVDPERILRDLGVELVDVDLDTPDIDAVAVFGPNHGPAVFINSSGQHAQGANGRRATLAHELCHFLRDRDGALPFAEAMSPDAPVGPERRARAFQAEFLLPQLAAIQHREAAAPSTRAEWQALVDTLAEQFRVSPAIAAWQLKNAHRPPTTQPLPAHVQTWLESMAKRRPTPTAG